MLVAPARYLVVVPLWGGKFVNQLPGLLMLINGNEKITAISSSIPSLNRLLIRPIPLRHVSIHRGDILPAPLPRKLFPSPPCLRRDGEYRTTPLPCAVVLRNNLRL